MSNVIDFNPDKFLVNLQNNLRNIGVRFDPAVTHEDLFLDGKKIISAETIAYGECRIGRFGRPYDTMSLITSDIFDSMTNERLVKCTPTINDEIRVGSGFTNAVTLNDYVTARRKIIKTVLLALIQRAVYLEIDYFNCEAERKIYRSDGEYEPVFLSELYNGLSALDCNIDRNVLSGLDPHLIGSALLAALSPTLKGNVEIIDSNGDDGGYYQIYSVTATEDMSSIVIYVSGDYRIREWESSHKKNTEVKNTKSRSFIKQPLSYWDASTAEEIRKRRRQAHNLSKKHMQDTAVNPNKHIVEKICKYKDRLLSLLENPTLLTVGLKYSDRAVPSLILKSWNNLEASYFMSEPTAGSLYLTTPSGRFSVDDGVLFMIDECELTTYPIHDISDIVDDLYTVIDDRTVMVMDIETYRSNFYKLEASLRSAFSLYAKDDFNESSLNGRTHHKYKKLIDGGPMMAEDFRLWKQYLSEDRLIYPGLFELKPSDVKRYLVSGLELMKRCDGYNLRFSSLGKTLTSDVTMKNDSVPIAVQIKNKLQNAICNFDKEHENDKNLLNMLGTLVLYSELSEFLER